MPQISRAYAVGRVRSLEKNLLDSNAIDRLISASTVNDVARMLSELSWGDASNQNGVERLADEHVSKACALLRECSTDPEITDCFLIKFDILNLKTLVKARLLGESEPKLSTNGTLDTEKMCHAISEGSYIFLPNEYKDALKEIDAKNASGVDPMWIDAQLDKLMYRLIFKKLAGAKKSDALVKELFIAQADATNMLIALRAGRMNRDGEFAEKLFVEGGRVSFDELKIAVSEPAKLLSATRYTPYADYVKRGLEKMEQGEGLAPFEKEMADYQIAVVKPHRYKTTSLMPLIGYMMAREREASAVRLIVTAKAVGASEETLVKRLRALYA